MWFADGSRARSSGPASDQPTAIMLRFSNTGDAAGTTNLRHVLRMPADSATSDMKPMYGNMKRVIVTEASNAHGDRPEPSSHTSSGAASMPTADVAMSAHSSTVATASTRR